MQDIRSEFPFYHSCYACGYDFPCFRGDDTLVVDAYAGAKGVVAFAPGRVRDMVCLDCLTVHPAGEQRIYNVCSFECQDDMLDQGHDYVGMLFTDTDTEEDTAATNEIKKDS